MWEEDNEAVESGQTDVADTSAGSEPSEVSSEPVEAAQAESAETTSEAAPDVFDWNGELESLKQEQWVNSLDESMRGSMIRGIETKYQNWARGYQKKFDELSKQRREADKTLESAREHERKAMQWLHGDVDPMNEKQREIDNLKVAHKAALETLRERAEMEHEKSKKSFGSERDQIIAARDHALSQHRELQHHIDQFEEALTEQEVTNLEEYMINTASDIYENDEAFEAFVMAWKGGFDVDQAIKMTRGIYPQQIAAPEPEPEPEPQPEPVPEGMKLMNMKPDAAAATEGGNPKSFDEMMRALKQEGQREVDMIRNS